MDIIGHLNHILKHKNHSKIFLVLYLKQFTWIRELKNSFGVNGFAIDEVLNYFEDIGFITFRDFYSIDEIYQEAISKLSPDFKYWLNSSPKIYVLTEKGKQAADKFADYIKEEIINNENMFNTFQYAVEKTAGSRALIDKITKEEENTLIRKVKSPYQDIIIEKETKLLKNIKEEVKQLPITEKYKIIGKSKRQSLPTPTPENRVGKSLEEIDLEVEKRQEHILEILGIENE